MTLAVVWTSQGPDAPSLREDLRAAGFELAERADSIDLVQDAIRNDADLIVCFERSPESALFERIAALGAAAPRPVVVFTTDQDADKIGRAAEAGVHAYVVNGYGRNRLRSVIHLAQARFRHEQSIREELAKSRRRFDERTLVDRAKGILMGARQLREEEAFRALRNAAMASQQRIGQVSQTVIDSARYGEAMNRAGQLRMLSQRLVKLYALSCARVSPEETAGLLAGSLAHAEDNFASLAKTLSRPTFGDLLDAAAAPWQRLRAALAPPAQAARLTEVDALAEELLVRAEQLTANLEVAAFATALRVINVSGRQRMLSQRLAKEALMRALAPGAASSSGAASGGVTAAHLVQGFAYLGALPLTSPEVSRDLAEAREVWAGLEAALDRAGTPAGREAIATLSEAMLVCFDRLTDRLERAMQALVG